MAFIEIIEHSLYQSDANSAVALKLEERAIRRAAVLDLHGLAERIEPQTDGIVWVRWPIEDGPIADPSMLHALAAFGEQAIAGGAAVVTMCTMGRNRSGLLAAMIASSVCGITGAEAMELVRKRNPEAIANHWFEEFLRSEI